MSGAVARKESQASPLRIVALTAGELAGEWEFEKDVVTVGRGAGADVCLKDNKKISRLHCVFEVREDGVWVKDANSVNGTWLNNRRITEAKVLPEDLVVVAGIRFRAFPAPRVTPDLEKTPAEISVSRAFFAGPKAAEPIAAAPTNVVPFRAPAAAPAEPVVDRDRTKPEIKMVEIELPDPERESARAMEPALPPQAPAFYVGGKRRSRSGARPAAPPAGLTGGQKLALVLVVGGAVLFGMVVVVAGTVAALMLG